MLKGLLFDKDATLLDFDKTWGNWCRRFLGELADGDDALFDRLAARIGFDPIAGTFDPASPVIAGTPEEGVDLVLPVLPSWTRPDLIAHSNAMARTAGAEPLVPLAPLLDDLGQSHVLGIATNDTEAAARCHMEALGVLNRFDLILGSDSGFGGKPDPGPCIAFATQMALAPAEVAMIGDSLHDVEAGRAAGMFCIAVTSGFAGEDELAPLADVVLRDVSALPEFLRNQS